MNSVEVSTQTTDRDAEAYRRILASNRKSYHNRYATDMEFRIKECKRNGEAIMRKYNSDPEYRQRMNEAAKARYHAKKAMLARDKQE